DRLKLAYRTPNTVEARALAMELNAAGVEVQITGDYSDIAYPGLALGDTGYKELWIEESNSAAAEAVVSQWIQSHHPGDLIEDRPAKPQYSLRMLLIAMTVIAIAVAIVQAGGAEAVAIALNFSIFALIAYFAWARWRRPTGEADDSDA